MTETMALIGKCGFYCGSCPDYRDKSCSGCRTAHSKGDCFTFDCVEEKGLDFCGNCPDFPCPDLFTRQKHTVLDAKWLQWKLAQRRRKEGTTESPTSAE